MPPPADTSQFFVTGGNLSPRAPSYIERAADQELYSALKAGQLSYVLTSRQMGKSSLFSRATYRLRQEGCKVSIIDLQSIGTNLTAAQWFDGMIHRVADDFDLEDEIDDFRDANKGLGPQLLWLEVLQHVVLAEIAGPVVIIFDEIDIVRTLPFSSDEFFTGIRALYNKRGENPALARLTFCLLGVASPADLIRDKQVTPFNVGRRIELLDFTEAEVLKLADGISRVPPDTARALVRRAHHWTGGQPYLTQRLCREVAERADVVDEAGVDRVCAEMYFSLKARETDINLTAIRDRILKDKGSLAAMLDVHRAVLKGQRVPDDDVDIAVAKLKLAGLLRGVDGALKVKNPIYAKTFDRAWVRANYPVDWKKRFYRVGVGLVLVSACSAPVAAVLWRMSETKGREAARQLVEAERNNAQAELAREREEAAKREIEAKLGEIQSDKTKFEALLKNFSAAQHGTLVKARRLWEAAGLRAYLAERANLAPIAFAASGDPAAGRVPAETYSTAETRLRPVARWTDSEVSVRQLMPVPGGWLAVTSADAFKPPTRLVHVAAPVPRAGDADTPRRTHHFPGYAAAVAWARDGERLWVIGMDGRLESRDLATDATRREAATFNGDPRAISLSPDGRTLVAGFVDGTVQLWRVGSPEVATLRPASRKEDPASRVWTLAWSPDGARLAAGFGGGVIELYDVAAGKRLGAPAQHVAMVLGLAWTPAGDRLASASRKSNEVKLWSPDLAPLGVLATAAEDEAFSMIAWAPDGRDFVTGLWGGRIDLWRDGAARTLAKGGNAITQLHWGRDGRIVAGSLNDEFWQLAADAPAGDPVPATPLRFNAYPGRYTLDTARGIVAAVDLFDAHFVQLYDVATARALTAERLVATTMLISDNGVAVARHPFRPDVTAIAFGGDEPLVANFTATPPKLTRLSTKIDPEREKRDARCLALAFSPDAQFLAASYAGGRVALYRCDYSADDKVTLTRLYDRVLEKSDGTELTTLVFTQGGRTFLAGSQPLRAYAASSGVLLSEDNLAAPAASSPDGYWHVAVNSVGGDPVYLRTEAGPKPAYTVNEVARLPGGGQPTATAFSPAGDWAVFGFADGSVRFDQGRKIGELIRVLPGKIAAVAPALDGRGFFAGDDQGECVYVEVRAEPEPLKPASYDAWRDATGLEIQDTLDSRPVGSASLVLAFPPAEDAVAAAYWPVRWRTLAAWSALSTGAPQPLDSIKITDLTEPLATFAGKFAAGAPDHPLVRRAQAELAVFRAPESPAAVGAWLDALAASSLDAQARLVVLTAFPAWREAGDVERARGLVWIAAGYEQRLVQRRAELPSNRQSAPVEGEALEEVRLAAAALTEARALGAPWEQIAPLTPTLLKEPALDAFVCEVAPVSVLRERFMDSAVVGKRSTAFFDAFRNRAGVIERFDDAISVGIELRDTGRLAEADAMHAVAERLAKTDDERARVLITRAYTLRATASAKPDLTDADRAKNSAAMVALIEQAVKLTPKSSRNLRTLASFRPETTEGRTAAAEDLRRALELLGRGEEGRADAVSSLVNTLFALGRNDEARTLALENADGYSAADAKAYWLNASAHLEGSADLDRDLEFVGQVLARNAEVENDDDVNWLLATRGVALRDRGHLREALVDLNLLVARRFDLKATLPQHAATLSRLGLLDEADRELERALAANPEDGWSLLERADIAALRGERERARELAVQAERVAPGVYGIDVALREARAGAFASATDRLAAIIAKNGEDVRAADTLMEVQLMREGWHRTPRQPMSPTARAYFERWKRVQLQVSATAPFGVAPIAITEGDFKRAGEVLAQARTAWPDSTTAWLFTAAAFGERGAPADITVALAAIGVAVGEGFYGDASYQDAVLLRGLRGDARFQELQRLFAVRSTTLAERDRLLAAFFERIAAELAALPPDTATDLSRPADLGERLANAVERLGTRPVDYWSEVVKVVTPETGSAAAGPAAPGERR